jgi:hypothetical protein
VSSREFLALDVAFTAEAAVFTDGGGEAESPLL